MKFGDEIDWNAEARRAAREGMPGAQPGELIKRVAATIMEDYMPGWSLISSEPRPRPVVVDCGCNIARFYPETEAAGLAYIGVDQADEALKIARTRYPTIKLVQAMLWDDWPKQVGPVHAAICNAVLQHNTHAEKKRILVRIAQALSPGVGVFAMQESTVPAETKTQLRQGDWVKLVEGFGFKLVEMWHPNQEHGIFDGYLFTRVSR